MLPICTTASSHYCLKRSADPPINRAIVSITCVERVEGKKIFLQMKVVNLDLNGTRFCWLIALRSSYICNG